jgi:sterol 3beta-glucosyltransferase
VRISLFTLGTRGDVQPFIALGLALKAAGHQVVLATGSDHERLVREYDLDFHSLPCRFTDYLATPAGWASFAPGRSFYFGLNSIWGAMRQEAEPLFWACWEALRDTDVAVCSPTAIPAILLLQRYQLPWFLAMLAPLLPTTAFPSPSLPIRAFGRLGHYLTHKLVGRRFWKVGRDVTSLWNQLTPLVPHRPAPERGTPLATFVAVSPHVVPPPTDWPSNVHTTGYWISSRRAAWEPSSELSRFITEHEAPICVTFGSMPDPHPEAFQAMVLGAVRRARQRAVVVTGAGALGAIPDAADVIEIGAAPFDWLLPRMRAVVHHGGAGTTADGLMAGVPSVIVPFLTDQPFWGYRVYDLGAGPRPILRRHLTEGRLEKAIAAAVGDESMRDRARALKHDMRAEDGTARALELIERYLAGRTPQ